MASIAEQFVTGARKAFDKLGVATQIRVSLNPEYITRSSVVRGTEQTYTVVATPPLNFNGEWTSSLLKVGDGYILIEAASATFDVKPGIEVYLDGSWVNCFGVEPLIVGSTTVAYIVKVRG